MTYTGGFDNLSLTYELYNLVLLDCQLILKNVVSPEHKSSLLVKQCVVCFIPRNRWKKFSDVSHQMIHCTNRFFKVSHPHCVCEQI
jgi:hypothetical protein